MTYNQEIVSHKVNSLFSKPVKKKSAFPRGKKKKKFSLARRKNKKIQDNKLAPPPIIWLRMRWPRPQNAGVNTMSASIPTSQHSRGGGSQGRRERWHDGTDTPVGLCGTFIPRGYQPRMHLGAGRLLGPSSLPHWG